MVKKKESKEAKELREIKGLLQEQQATRQRYETTFGVSWCVAAIITGLLFSIPLGLLAWNMLKGGCGWICQFFWFLTAVCGSFVLIGIAGLIGWVGKKQQKSEDKQDMKELPNTAISQATLVERIDKLPRKKQIALIIGIFSALIITVIILIYFAMWAFGEIWGDLSKLVPK